MLEGKLLLSVASEVAHAAIIHTKAPLAPHVIQHGHKEAAQALRGTHHPTKSHSSGVASDGGGTFGSVGYNVAQLRHAYGIDQLSQYTGAGETIAIVDPYNDSAIKADLHTFDVANGLPDPTLLITAPGGHLPGSQPANSTSDWYAETSLDVEWAHAIAPKATIILVEAQSTSIPDLYNAIDYASSTGAQIVSMSFSSSPAQLAQAGTTANALDAHFMNTGVSYLASSGDDGFIPSGYYPAGSPYVTSVGGTTLLLNSSSNRAIEVAWSLSGGGAYIGEPLTNSQRPFRPTALWYSSPTVSYNAGYPVGVYSTYDGGWIGVEGTSAGAPQWAGIVALADQGRAVVGKPQIGWNLNRDLYQLAGGASGYTNPDGDFYDITSGSNGQPATVGYDLATGLGSPVATKLIPDLINKV